MGPKQHEAIGRWRDMGYDVTFERRHSQGIIEVSMPRKLTDTRLRLVVRPNGTFAPAGHWRHDPHNREDEPCRT